MPPVQKILTLSFDDGTMQDVRLVGILNRYGLKCTFNLNSGLLGQKHRIIHEGIDCDHTEITGDMVHDLYQGHEIAVHTVHHPKLTDLSKDEIIREVKGDQEALEALWGQPIRGMAYPGGPFFNEFVISTILENTPITYARTTNSHRTFQLPKRFMEWNPTCHQNDSQLFSLAEQFLNGEPDGIQLFYLWGHSFEFDKFQSWDAFERFCSLMADHRETISFMTNGQVKALIEGK